MAPVLAAGFAVHIAMAFILSWQNCKARGREKYASGSKAKVSWASQKS
jgi:succinate dehydrogenase / fumarate reductase cytochrome b subunit